MTDRHSYLDNVGVEVGYTTPSIYTVVNSASDRHRDKEDANVASTLRNARLVETPTQTSRSVYSSRGMYSSACANAGWARLEEHPNLSADNNR